MDTAGARRGPRIWSIGMYSGRSPLALTHARVNAVR